MNTFKFTTVAGNSYRVRFYETGGYTVFDKNGEHEAGSWRRTEGGYEGRAFESGYTDFSFKMRELAWQLLRKFMYRK